MGHDDTTARQGKVIPGTKPTAPGIADIFPSGSRKHLLFLLQMVLG